MSIESFRDKFTKAKEDAQDTYLDIRERAAVALNDYLYRMEKKIGKIDSVDWQLAGFDLDKELATRSGTLVEVGGPTRGFAANSPRIKRNVRENIITTNIEPKPIHSDRLHSLPRRMHRVDLVADARQLPFADESVGAIFASYMWRSIRADILIEASRALEKGGLLLWQGAFIEDFDHAREGGLQLVAYEWDMPENISTESMEDRDVQVLHAQIAARLRKKAEQTQAFLVAAEEEQIPEHVEKTVKTVYFEYGIAPDIAIFRK